MADLSIGRFAEKGRQLQNILISLLEDDEFVRLVYFTDGGEIPPLFDRYQLLNTHLYTQIYEPPTDTQVVNINVYYKRSRIANNNNYYKNTDIGIAIVVHRELWQTDTGLRAFEIADRVDLILNRKNVTKSLSKDWFTDMKYYPVNNLYNVVELTYSNWD